MSSSSDRYSRQVLLAEVGPEGQAALSRATAAIVGLGALGTVSASYLARAGVGTVRLVDRDVVELGNLQRQVLYTEADARDGLPKAAAAEARLREVNSEIAIVGRVEDLTSANIDRLLEGVDLVVDGMDNFETRYLVNEWCVQEGVPWIYGAAVGAYGLTFPVLPGETPCLACVFEAPPPPELAPTCDTVGVLGPLTGVIGALQASEALKILAGRREAVSRALTAVDLWSGRVQRVDLSRREDQPCPVCVERRFPHLEGRAGVAATRLCGRNAVQVSRAVGEAVDLDGLAARLRAAGEVSRNRFLIRARVEGYDLTIFADGRTLVSGTDNLALARSLVARYVGA